MKLKYFLVTDTSFSVMPDHLAKDFWQTFADVFGPIDFEGISLDSLASQETALDMIRGEIESGNTVHAILHGAPTYFTAYLTSYKYKWAIDYIGSRRPIGSLIIHVIYRGAVDFYVDTV